MIRTFFFLFSGNPTAQKQTTCWSQNPGLPQFTRAAANPRMDCGGVFHRSAQCAAQPLRGFWGGGTPSTSCSAHPSPYNGNVRRPFPYPYCLLCRQRVSVQNICMLEKGSALHCLRIWRSNLCVGQRNKTANKTVNAHPVFCMHHAFVKVCCAGDSSTEIF